MRYLVLTDLHANLQAFDAVMADAEALGYDEVLVLGDLVGYGADPAAVIDRTLALEPVAMIRGNHDKVCCGLESPAMFNDAARAAAEWTADMLDAARLEVLRGLPKGPLQVNGARSRSATARRSTRTITCSTTRTRRARQMRPAGASACSVTRTCPPCTPPRRIRWWRPRNRRRAQLPMSGPVLLNVGSVGQPRDGDPRAAYGLLDQEQGRIRLRRVPYDVKAAQDAILKAGLPAWLAIRLERGQ